MGNYYSKQVCKRATVCEVVSWQNELQVPGTKWGLERDVICKTDFGFDEVVDKATACIRRLKSGKVDSKWYPKPADIRQQCLYRSVGKLYYYIVHQQINT